jgi:phage terminase large subunit-like protein
VDVPQTTETFDPAMTKIETLIEGGRLTHDGNEAMAWMIANVQVQRSNLRDEKYPVKADGKDSSSKIDGPVALMTAMCRAMQSQEQPREYRVAVIGGSR